MPFSSTLHLINQSRDAHVSPADSASLVTSLLWGFTLSPRPPLSTQTAGGRCACPGFLRVGDTNSAPHACAESSLAPQPSHSSLLLLPPSLHSLPPFVPPFFTYSSPFSSSSSSSPFFSFSSFFLMLETEAKALCRLSTHSAKGTLPYP